jgi:hypothetical protein
MEKNKSNWWIDLILLGLFWISFFPGLTSLALHEWLGLAAVLLAVWHLIAHWAWVEAVTLKFFSRLSAQSRIFYMLDFAVLVGFVMILSTGLLISTWLDLPLYDMAAWTRIHLMVSVFTLALAALKLILHWRWIACTARRYAFEPVFGSAPAAGSSRTANPVSRRDFLFISGLFGAATVLTIHSLFDAPLEAQAQSAISESPDPEDPQPTAATAETPASGSVETKAEAPTAAQIPPSPTPEPAVACVVRCPNGCSYPGQCRKYVDRNGNNLCDNGECL